MHAHGCIECPHPGPDFSSIPISVNPSSSLGSLSRDHNTPQPVRRIPAWIIPAAIAAGFFLLFFAMFRDRILPAPDVEVAIALTTPINQGAAGNPSDPSGRMLFQASGWIEPDPFPVKATSLVDGVVDTVTVLEGQNVTKGEEIASLIDVDARLELAMAEQKLRTLKSGKEAHFASISSARKRLEAARAQIEAALTLRDEAADRVARFATMKKDAVPESDVVSARLRLTRENSIQLAFEAGGAEQEAEILRLELETKVKEDEIASAAIEVEQAKLALSRTRIVAPIGGRVLRLHAAPGQKKMLQNDAPDSTTIATLYDPARLQVRVDVPLTDAAGLQTAQSVRIRCGLLPDRVFHGEVTRITGEADLQRNTLQAKVRIIDPADELRPEMLCRVEFLAKTAASPNASTTTALATWIPTSALSGGHVWLCDPETKRIVKRAAQSAGETRDGFTRILSGVSPGEWVILSPQALRNGQRVNPKLVHQP
jgi:multidrug efflux pump subunit AcrA (membrane-fusion protein)